MNNVLKKIKNRIVGEQDVNDKDDCCLLGLGPEYDESRHGLYLRLLKKSLENGCRNIAVSGPYGSGKSSILSQYQHENARRTILISLWELAPLSQSAAVAPEGSGEVRDYAGALTNALEREVVRQLLYCGNHARVPRSRFNRIHQTGRLRILLPALGAALFFTAIYLLIDGSLLRALFPDVSWLTFIAWPALIFLSVFVLVACILPGLSSSIKSGGLSTSFATLSLEKGETSYFDKYLDEIVYFFEANPYDTVIFEDLDRFNDPSVYMHLKDLNRVLNNAPGIIRKRGDRGIRFVYAIRDSIFDVSTLEQSSRYDARACEELLTPGSNRVKFFDSIIPVTPFLSELNSPDMALDLFSDVIGQDSELAGVVRVIAPHVTDMRLLKEIRNEYLILLHVLLPEDQEADCDLGVTRSGILAMAAYRCVNSSDFEKIRRGDSNLDKLYELHADFVKTLINNRLYQRGKIKEARKTEGVNKSEYRKIERDLSRTIEELRKADFCDCWQYFNEANSDERDLSFGDYVVSLVGGGLCSDLIKHGYIGRDYAIYASTYPAGGHGRAINFFVHHIRNNDTNIEYHLEPEDAKEVISRSAGSDYAERCYLNVDLFRYALKNNKEVAKSIINAMANYWNSAGREFLDAVVGRYQAEGNGVISSTFVGLLVSEWRGAFDYLFSLSSIDSSLYKENANVALGNINPEIDYSFSSSAEYFKENYQKIKAFGRNWSKPQARGVMKLIEGCGIVFDELRGLRGNLKELVVRSGRYALSRENIFLVLPSRYQSIPPIDTIKSVSPRLYERIIKDGDSFLSYVRLLEPREPALVRPSEDDVVSLVKDVIKNSSLRDELAIRRYVLAIAVHSKK